MNTNLLTYPAYKPSGVDWLGNVPAHWEVRRLKHSVKLIMGQSPSSDECGTEPEGLPFLQGCAEFGSLHPNPSLYCRAPKKTGPTKAILMSVRAPVGRLNVADQEYCIGRGLCALIPQEELFQSVFAFYQLYALQHGLALASTGSTYDAVSIGDVGSQPTILPPLPEQHAIARYLDHIDRRIQRYIDTKEKLIALLQEARQATIHRAVTRGLDPDVPLKPSGVDWLGDVPAHWEIRRLKTLCTMKSGDWIDAVSIESEGEIPVYGGNGLRGFTSNYNQDGAFALIGRQGALCGNVHIACGKFWATEHAVVTTLDSGHDVVWFGAILTAMDLNQYSIAAAQPGLSVERILNLHLPVPPTAEQERIAAHLDKATTAIDATIDNARRQADLMREYRASLIAHVVTGKLDVRAAAEHIGMKTSYQ